jgi:hypothetical protein
MQRTTHARNTIGPLLDQLILQLHTEGRATQCAYFARIRHSLCHACHEIGLATPILELSASVAVGFHFSSDADVLIARILEKAEQLAAELEYSRPILH